jgi:SsrA-binding protein
LQKVKHYKKINLFEKKISETRDRDLLLLKTEINKLKKNVKIKGLTIVPLSIIYSDTKKVKVEIAICKGKKLYDKRHALKIKQQELDIKRKNKYN